MSWQKILTLHGYGLARRQNSIELVLTASETTRSCAIWVEVAIDPVVLCKVLHPYHKPLETICWTVPWNQSKILETICTVIRRLTNTIFAKNMASPTRCWSVVSVFVKSIGAFQTIWVYRKERVACSAYLANISCQLTTKTLFGTPEIDNLYAVYSEVNGRIRRSYKFKSNCSRLVYMVNVCWVVTNSRAENGA